MSLLPLQRTHDFIGFGWFTQLAVAFSDIGPIVSGLTKRQQVVECFVEISKVHVVDGLTDIQLLVIRKMVESLADQFASCNQITFFL